MELIVRELKRNGVYMGTIPRHVERMLKHHGNLIDQMANNINPYDMNEVFNMMEVNNFGRAIAFIALVLEFKLL